METLKTNVTKIVKELRKSMVNGWGVVELKESVEESQKTRKN
ncbi:hypothetical protein [Neobacillus drentensis]